MNILQTDNLTLTIGSAAAGTERVLCRDLSIKFAAGENWAILGANGCGKTTLLYALAGLHAPTSGSVKLNGEEIKTINHHQRAQQIGVLFQHTDIVFPASVIETVLTGRHPHMPRSHWSTLLQWETTDDYQIASEALQQVEMQEFSSRRVDTLSGGERRRVEIAALLAQDPPICLLDEPNNELDLNYQLKILSLLAARTQKPGNLNLFVMHDINMALRFCSHGLLVFADGETRHGRLDELLNTEILEKLYHCPFHQVSNNQERVYIPGEP